MCKVSAIRMLLHTEIKTATKRRRKEKAPLILITSSVSIIVRYDSQQHHKPQTLSKRFYGCWLVCNSSYFIIYSRLRDRHDEECERYTKASGIESVWPDDHYLYGKRRIKNTMNSYYNLLLLTPKATIHVQVERIDLNCNCSN